jgi:hypothetical protein
MTDILWSQQHTDPARFVDHSPCDSPIEDIFYREAQKWLAEGVTLDRQVECVTPIAAFRLDFCAEVGPRKIGIECDGKEFHSRDRDFRRDTAIIQAGCADVIYRLAGKEIVHHLHDCLDLLRIAEPRLFSERGRRNIEALASRPFEDVFAIGRATRIFLEPEDCEQGWDKQPPATLTWLERGEA